MGSADTSVRILLVEDNAGDARLIRETLREAESLRFDLTHVARLGEALEAVQAQALDVVLLDLSLPDAHGMETVERMLAAAPALPIIVLTGLADETVAVHAGAQDYLVKGTVEGGTLARAIRYAIERKRLGAERERLLTSEREARAAAEAAVNARDEVLRIVAHDIGNALSAMKVHATVLHRTLPDPEGDAAKRALAIRDMAQQVERLRQDLLDVAAIEAGRLSFEPNEIVLADVVDDVLGTAAALAQERRLELCAEVPADLPAVWADRERVGQMLANLVGNAVKFTPPDGRVTVRACAHGEEARVVVADTGPGIPAEHLPHVFDRFWQARGTRRAGAGLGLAIARGIIEGHGGRIWVESEPGAGTRFFFSLPFA
jgi:signal transduction histidine kinase